jgi:uncharacterized protein (TIGR03083 family)
MDRAAYIDSLRRDGHALASAAESDLGAAVRSCPGWDVAKLVWHVLEVHSFWGQIAGRQMRTHEDAVTPARPDRDRLIQEYRAGVDELADILSRADPETEVWTWAPDRNVGFIQRRMAQETAIHRWDAQSAVGDPQPIAPDLAVDGIDEFLDLFLPHHANEDRGPPYSVHLHSTDRTGEWVVRVAGERIEVARTHERGDAAARGTSSDLLLMLWRRGRAPEIEVLGDATVIDRFLARADLD